MVFKIKRGRPKKISAEYFQQKEIETLRKKYPHQTFLPFSDIVNLGQRRTFGIEERIHRTGAVIKYKDGLAKIKRVTKRGVWIEPFTKPTTRNIASPSGRVIFVSEKEVEKKFHPIGTRMPFFFNPPVQFA